MSQPLSRRRLMAAGSAFCLITAGSAIGSPGSRSVGQPRVRVIIDNDFGGDPDGLFQIAHFLMCKSVTVPLIVGSHYRDFGAADLVPDKAQASVRKVEEVLAFFPQSGRPQVLAGSNTVIAQPDTAKPGDVSAAIIREAMRTDISAPLFYAAGGSLTDIALAWLAEPRIGRRLRLLWIGGAEYPDLAAPPPGPAEPEYNFSLDPVAAEVVFNRSDIELWQVPRNAFRQMLVSEAELEEMARLGPLGRYLHRQVRDTDRRLAEHMPSFIYSGGETYAVGDTALVTLAALQSGFQPDTSSSAYVVRPTPHLARDGSYRADPTGRAMRIYNSIDANLTWRDFMAKLRIRSNR